MSFLPTANQASNPPPKFGRKVFWGVGAILAVAVGFLVWQIWWPVGLAKSVEFAVAAGESPKSVANRLAENGVIRQPTIFLAYLKWRNLDTQIEAGQFNFGGRLNLPAVAQILQKGGTTQIRVTILEGWNISQIDEYLTGLGLIQPNDFGVWAREGGGTVGNRPADLAASRGVASLEGYLFPSTYFVDPNNFSVESLTNQMLQTLEQKIAAAGLQNPAGRSFREVMILASILELEENDEKNLPAVADILWRRLDTGMPLGADATLFYVLGHQKILTAADLKIDSPYNTRKFAGLPPTPVGNPGLAAILAAANPTPNEFWYYLHDSSGQIHFAKTLAEHNENKAKYLGE